ncbi:MAG: hypothetical protein O7J95_19305 [Planctomycetota bacterium]|nr:hypothetical protein [Planctomycetota bacterium]
MVQVRVLTDVSRRSLFLLLSALFLTALPGCVASGKEKTKQPAAPRPPDSLRAYFTRVREGLERFKKLDTAAASTPHSPPEAIRGQIRRSAESFSVKLRHYFDLTSNPQPPWRAMTADSFGALRDECLKTFRDLKEHSQEFSVASTSVRRHFDQLAGSMPVATTQTELKAVRDYTSHCEKFQQLFRTYESELVKYHEKTLARGLDIEHPARNVLAFLLLKATDYPELEERRAVYDECWRAWIDAQTKSLRPDLGLGILAFIFTATDDDTPRSLKSVLAVVQSCLDLHPKMDIIKSMELSLRSIESSEAAHGEDEEFTRRLFRRARATLLLCRAHAVGDPEQGLPQAISALRQSEQLTEPVRSYFLAAGQALLDKYAPEFHYSRAVSAYRQALEESQLRDWESLALKFRRHVVERGLADLEQARARGQFDVGKKILAEASQIMRSGPDAVELERRRYDFYLEYARSAQKQDVEAYLRVCREMVEVFPDDRAALEMLDRAYVQRLQRKVGELETSFRRHTAERILGMIRKTTDRVTTEKGTAACQRFFSLVQEAWLGELGRTRDPHVAVRLTKELGELSGWREDHVRQTTLRALNRIYIESVQRQDWSTVERSLAMLMTGFPGAKRPPGFRETHVRLLEHLNRSKELDKLARQVVLFATAYPDKKDLVQPYIEQHLGGDPDTSQTFYAALKAVDSAGAGGASGDNPAAHRGGPTVPGELLSPLISEWPSPGTAGQASSRGAGERPNSGRRERAADDLWPAKSRPISMAAQVVAGTGVVGSVLFGGVLFLVTLVRGPGRFRWYVLTALWMGITTGMLLTL